jgi:hypothetical protein
MSGKRTTVSALTRTIFGDETDPVAAECAAWMLGCAPFLAFVAEQQTKIRKKVKGAQDAEGLRDVAFELATAYWLLQDRRVALRYEQYLAGKVRGPDFTVTFKGHIVFNVEVRRMRTAADAGKAAVRLIDVVCEKLDQMPPSVANVLVVGCDSTAPEVGSAMKRLHALAEARQDTFFAERGFRDTRDFLRALPRLGGVLVRGVAGDPGAEASSSAVLWLNAGARHPLPLEVRNLLQRKTC